MVKIKVVLATLLVAMSLEASAQSDFAKMLMNTPFQPVVLNNVEAQVLTPSSTYFYPAIYARYEKGDTTLTLEDYRYLYYGYMFQSEYSPHKETPYVDSLSNLLSRNGGVFREQSIPTSLRYLDKILEDRPFSLKFLNIMTYMYSEKIRDNEKALQYSYKYNMVLSAIFSSGSGRVKTSPWKVLYRSDALAVMAFLGVEPAKRVYITTNVEYYNLKEKQGDARGYYFDFDPIYTRPFEPKGKRKMEFNPLTNPNSDRYINKKIK